MGRNHPNSLAGTGCTAIFLIVWLTGWSAGTLFFDGMCVHNFIAQYQARDYPSVIGNVTHSKVRVHHDSDGTSRSAEIKYKYMVGRQKLEGTAVRFGANINGINSANETVRRFPVGMETSVYYRPDDPSEAALEIGISPMDFFLPIFLTPFNMIMLGGWTALTRRLLGKWTGGRPPSIRVDQRGLTRRYRVFGFDPMYGTMIGAGAAGFICTFIVGFGQMLLPVWPLVFGGWIVIFGAAIWGSTCCKPSVILLNEARGTLTMRVKDKETKLNTSEIDKVTATTRPPMNKRKNSTATKSRVLIHANDGNEIELPCGSAQVGNWLRDRIIADLHLRV